MRPFRCLFRVIENSMDEEDKITILMLAKEDIKAGHEAAAVLSNYIAKHGCMPSKTPREIREEAWAEAGYSLRDAVSHLKRFITGRE